ncbi:MAG: hypothetical protein KIT62_01580 [Cyclobacteriaceae bacterium]|nr:hypothetical protein [Cyclobacteriaceae bacterium]
MTIDEQLKYCRICDNRKMNPAFGLVCGLTNEKPAFEINCPDFKIDQGEADRLIQLEHDVKEEEESTGMFAPEKKAIKMGVWGGIIMIAVALIWFIAGWINGYIYFYPPILLGIGVYAIIKGLKK